MIKLELTDKEMEYLFVTLEQNYADIDPGEDFFSNTKTTLEGKMISKHLPLIDVWTRIHKNKFHKENEFDSEPLFMGGGIHTLNRANILHRRLGYAMSTLSGAQQNGGIGTEFNDDSDIRDTQEIKKTLKDIIAAFGYKPEDLI